MWRIGSVEVLRVSVSGNLISSFSGKQQQFRVPGHEIDKLLPRNVDCHPVVTTIKGVCLP